MIKKKKKKSLKTTDSDRVERVLRDEGLEFEDYTTEQAEKDAAEQQKGKYANLVSGKNMLRIVPARKGESWKKPFYKHFVTTPGGGKAVFFCPKMHTNGKRKCPTCADNARLYATGDARDKARADKQSAQRKCAVNAVDRKNEDAGPKTYELSPGIEKTLTNWRKIDDINFMHPEDGIDVWITKTGEGKEGTRYDTKTNPKGCTPLHKSVKVMRDWIENQPDLEKHVRLESDEDIAARLRGEDPSEGRGKGKKSRSRDDDDEEELDVEDADEEDDEDESDEDDEDSDDEEEFSF